MDGKFELDARDSLVLKGLAILAISFHNYFHLLTRVKENEFDFNRQRFLDYLGALQEPPRILQASFSFLGHYGVQIFVFLSAYGLAVRYWDEVPRWATFVWGRVRKLYPMFLLAIALWALWVGLPQGLMGPVEVIRQQSGVLALTLLGIVNIVPGYDLPPVGPWWYMPFVMQFYCLWPLLRRFSMRFGRRGLLILSVASLVLTYMINSTLKARWDINLLETPLAHLPECCLGIAVARFHYRPGPVVASLSSVVFVVSNVVRPLWLLSFISGLTMIVWSYHVLQPVLRRSQFLVKVGGYSMALFLVNGFIRFPFLELAARAGVWYGRLVYGVASVSLALTVALVLTAVTSYRFGRLPALATARPESG